MTKYNLSLSIFITLYNLHISTTNNLVQLIRKYNFSLSILLVNENYLSLSISYH